MNQKTLLGTTNKLIKTAKKHDVVILSWDLPAKKTCPNANLCLKGCYASRGNYLYKDKQNKSQKCLELSKTDDLISYMDAVLYTVHIEQPDKKVYVRLHSSGDIYNVAYFERLMTVARHNPNVTFYGYTKSVSIVKNATDLIPDNVIMMFSFGGLEDELIDTNHDKHAIVVKDKNSVPNGYVLGNDDDLLMLNYDKIAFAYHGQTKWEKSGFNLVKIE